jgi:zinc transport system substrate-binding protein
MFLDNSIFSMKRLILGLVFAGAFSSGCRDEGATRAERVAREGPLVVCTANYPLYYFADRIAGNRIDLRFLAPADEDPAFWKPSVEEIGEMQEADVLFLNGATYEKWLATVTMPPSILYNTSREFSESYISVEEAVTHTHGNGEAHAHAGTAFTTWLDFGLARRQAEAIRGVLARKLPESEGELNASAEELFTDLDRLDEIMRSAGSALEQQPLLASHPVYQYFTRRYDLNLRSVHWEPETIPDAEAMKELKAILREHSARWMVWEGEPHPESARKLKALGIGSLVFDPCGNRPEKGDWLSVMEENLQNLEKAAP